MKGRPTTPVLRMVALLPITAIVPFAGCSASLSRGESAFADGRYPDAKEAFVSLEAESATWNEARRAEYALYRGLTHAALGDRAQAGLWLRAAKAIEDGHPASLSPQDGQRLLVGLDNLGPE